MDANILLRFKPQKVLHVKDELAKKNPKLHGIFAITEKHNGWDFDIIFDGTKFLPLRAGRSGREVPSVAWVSELLNKELGSCYDKPFILKAEGIVPNVAFEVANGMFNRTKGEVALPSARFKIHNLFDPSNVTATYIERRNAIHTLAMPLLNPDIFQITPILYTGAYDEKVWDKFFQQITSEGGEGIVAARTTSVYAQGKRNSDLLKRKLEIERDCLAIRLEESTGEKGNFGLTLVSKRKNGAEIRTVIGRHDLQEAWLADPSLVLGKVVQIRGMYDLPDGTIKECVFSHIRYDKTADDIE